MKFYTKKINDEETVVYICNIAKLNDIVMLDINAGDILNYSDNTYEYQKEQSEKKEKFNISKEKYMIYNGESLSDLSDFDSENDYFIPEYGKVKLIDNDCDGNYDVISVTEYTTYVIQSIDQAEKVIYDKYNSPNLYLAESDNTVIINNSTGKNIKLSSLKEWDVLTVAQSKDKKMTRIIVSNETIVGEVVEMEYDSDRTINKLYFGDIVYGAAVKTELRSVKDYFTTDNIHIGTSGIFYLNHEGKIVAFKPDTLEGKLGYLVNAVLESGVEARIQFKIFTASQEMLILESGDKIKIDSSSGMKCNEALEKLSDGNGCIPQMISYEVSPEGKVISIDTPYDRSVDVNEEDESNFRLTYKGYQMFSTLSRSFNGKAILINKPTIFVIPNNPKNADESDFSIVNDYYAIGDQQSEASHSCNTFECYSTLSDSLLSNIVVANLKEGFHRLNGFATWQGVIFEMTQCIYKEEPVTKFEIQMEAKKMTIYLKNKTIMDNRISIGDFVEFKTNVSDEVKSLTLMYDVENNELVGTSNPDGSFMTGSRIYFANVYEKCGSQVTIAHPNTNLADNAALLENLELHDLSSCQIFIYDRNKQKIKSGTINDIFDYKHAGENYSKILIDTNKTTPKYVVIYK